MENIFMEFIPYIYARSTVTKLVVANKTWIVKLAVFSMHHWDKVSLLLVVNSFLNV